MNEYTDATEGLKTVAERAADRLRQGEALNERAVEYTVVMPIVRALGWNPENLDEMRPEYAVESRKVDWAFLKEGTPCLFLEEKAPDQNLSAHEEQLLDYAFKQGIRLAVLTNGREWWFYLPLEEGPWRERRFLTINLMTGEIGRICVDLKKFLGKKLVHKGLSHKYAKKLYDQSKEIKRIERELPAAIQQLFLDPSPQVIEFVQNQTQGVIGALPPPESVKKALKVVFADGAHTIEDQGNEAEPPGLGLPPTRAHLISLAIQGQTIPVSHHWNQILTETANWLIRQGYDVPTDTGLPRQEPLIRTSKVGLTHPKRLDNGLYIRTSYYSAPKCVKLARWLLRQAGLPEENLQVEWEERSR
ncbi:MAG: hypothetical protein KAW89_00525 [Armatimonadetes bacterium]|nr:hypothetical protein [Armatimonadota bacterium]